ncbi:MAG: rRNA maturation RNase YbeY [Bacteroidota bacterium]|nr:rRNA maturation RNase YbeY [Bacteroidota bacterium]MDX5446918.1 rRNA maturation RNase YbeY [Bacteroidota bacterium]MDX5505154.1 rRNA maturation RNase YbeY [Bacteroidota bacterium]
MAKVLFHGPWDQDELSCSQITQEWIESIVLSHGLKLGSLNINLVDDDSLLSINRQHLDHDYYTDIITFEYSRYPRIKGELWISFDRVKENAQAHKVGYSEEMARVVAHGVLHLCGFGDKDPNELAIMRKEEDKALILRAL